MGVNLSRIAAGGESSGGFLSLQSAFLFNGTARIRAVIAQYPAMYVDIASYNPRPVPKDMVPAGADAVVDEYMARVKRGELPVRLSSPWPELEGLLNAMGQTGRHREMLGGDERLTLGFALKEARAKGEGVPAIWVVQGEDDKVVSLIFFLLFFLRMLLVRVEATVTYI